jgi:hypothetical protein
LDVLFSAFIVAAALMWAALRIARELALGRAQGSDRTARLLEIFAPAAAAGDDPRALLAWQPVAAAARNLFPSEFAAIDKARGATFPFSVDQIRAAHSRWTAEWLAWERSHDAECKLRAAAVEHELGDQVATSYGRARMDAVERDKLEQYQRRYEEYTRIAKGLQALADQR